MNKGVVIGVVVAIMFAGGGFWGGMTYAKSTAQSARAQFAGGGGAGRTGGRSGGGAFGTIIAKDATSITVQLGGPGATSTNGTNTGSKIILYSNSTQIGKFVSDSASGLSLGENVSVMGTANSDGSITAQSIQIRPAGTNGRFGGQ